MGVYASYRMIAINEHKSEESYTSFFWQMLVLFGFVSRCENPYIALPVIFQRYLIVSDCF